jgi:glyoxylase-like metal-dependent hydrolase (beta-lactamase superfamily II)
MSLPPLRWRVGDVAITQIVESAGSSPPGFLFADLSAEQVRSHAWLRPHFATAEGRLIASIHAFVVESCGRTIVVDTGVGHDKQRARAAWNQRQGPFLRDFAGAGFAPERVDVVVCTHFHSDHVGWNTRLVDGRWLPTFANARYLASAVEHRHLRSHDDPAERQLLADSVQPVVDAGLFDWVATDHAITGEVRLEPTPGHTPGHVSVRIRSRGAEAVITGDLMHHPLQCAAPNVCSRFDDDQAEALATRVRFLREQADRDVLVLGTHFAAPTAGRVVADGATWRFAVEPAGG